MTTRSAPDIRALRERGMSLVEATVGALLTMVILFTLLSVYDAAQKLSRDQAEAMQVDTNLRAAMEVMARDIEQAGVGVLNTGQGKRLGATIFPNRSAQFACCTNTFGYTDSEISMLINLPGPLTTTTRVGVWAELLDDRGVSGTAPIAVNIDWNAAEWAVGDRVIIIGPINGGNTVGEWFTVGAVDPINNTITPATSLPAYSKTSVIMKATMVSYWRETDSDGVPVLMRREGTDFDDSSHFTQFPVAENVIALRYQYYGNDVPIPNELTTTSTPDALPTNNGRKELRMVRISLTAETELFSRTKRNAKLKPRTFISEVSPRNKVARGEN